MLRGPLLGWEFAKVTRTCCVCNDKMPVTKKRKYRKKKVCKGTAGFRQAKKFAKVTRILSATAKWLLARIAITARITNWAKEYKKKVTKAKRTLGRQGFRKIDNDFVCNDKWQLARIGIWQE